MIDLQITTFQGNEPLYGDHNKVDLNSIIMFRKRDAASRTEIQKTK